MSNNILTIKKIDIIAANTDASDWIKVPDWKYQHQQVRTIIGNLTSTDSISVELTHAPTEAEIADYPTHSRAYTDTSFDDTLNGPFTYIRVKKTGTAGAASISLAI